MGIVLFKHNLNAYKAAVEMLGKFGKAAIIHPTGTGKSFIGFKLAEDNCGKRILWLSPGEYIVKTQLENLKQEAEIILNNINFITYAKLMYMSEEEILELNPDYIVMDEFHRCGAEKWGKGVQTLIEIYPNAMILGLSATNIRYLDNNRDMAEEIFDNHIASEMTLGEAIVRNILPAPQYVISIYSYESEIDKYKDKISNISNIGVRKKTQEEMDALCKALENAKGLDEVFKKHIKDKNGKYIVFCSNNEHMREMIGKSREWFGGIDADYRIYKVYSESIEADSEFTDFKNDNSEHLKLLFCIDMLNEGVHVDGVDGVILFRPTVSPIIYKQQIGRALSAGKSKSPVIFDVVNNFANLYSIATIQDEINLAVSYYRELGENDCVVNEDFRIFDETFECKRLFESIEKNLSSSWEIYFNAARDYFAAYKNLNVPKRYVTDEGLALGMWINTQRRIRNGSAEGLLTEDRIKRLDSIGMVWGNIQELRWEKGFSYAQEYFNKYHNLDIKADFVTKDGFKLGKWITQNRQRYTNKSCASLLTEDRVKRLENIGMVWSKNNAVWEKNYILAVEYFNKNGNVNMPDKYVDASGVKLGSWLERQKKLYRKGELEQEQAERLEMLGIEWESKFDVAWKQMYAEAEHYYNANGNLNVPSNYKSEKGAALGKWISAQRSNKKLSDEKKALLNKIDMVWQTDPWEKKYSLAKQYFEENGNLDVPPTYKTQNNVWLGKWLYTQRKIYRGEEKGESLTQEQIQKLEAVGMDWRTSAEKAWDEKYAEVKEYFEKHGNVDIPSNFVSKNGDNLFVWLRYQRKKMRENMLTDEQEKRLKDLKTDLESQSLTAI